MATTQLYVLSLWCKKLLICQSVSLLWVYKNTIEAYGKPKSTSSAAKKSRNNKVEAMRYRDTSQDTVKIKQIAPGGWYGQFTFCGNLTKAAVTIVCVGRFNWNLAVWLAINDALLIWHFATIRRCLLDLRKYTGWPKKTRPLCYIASNFRNTA